MRDLLVFAVVVLSLPLAFRRPFFGLLVFSWLAYMRPQDLCWSFARTMRFSFLAAITMLTGWLVNESGTRRFMHWDVRTTCMVALGAMMTVSLLFAESKSQYVMQYFVEFLKILLIALFTTGQVTTRQRLRALLWIICLSLAFYGVKNGILGILRGGSPILRGPGGMLEDNNDFALALVMNIPLLHYLGRSEGSRLIQRASEIGVLLTLVTILLTHSRGGFLAALCTLLLMAWRSGRLLQAFGVLGAGAVLFWMLAPEHVIDRIASIGEGTEDSSASARIKSWTVGIRMIETNPLIGVGIRNFQEHYMRHTEGLGIDPEGFAFVAHNSYIQIWAEGGTPAFIVYMVLLGSVFWTCSRLRAMGRARLDLGWVHDYARLLETSMAGFVVGAVFLNRGHFDLAYHFMALVTVLSMIARTEWLRGAPVGFVDRRRGEARVARRHRRPGARGRPVWQRLAERADR